MLQASEPEGEAEASRRWYARPAVWMVLGSLVLAGVLISSFFKHPPTPGGRGAAATSHNADLLLDNVVNFLATLDQYDSKAILPQVVDRLNQWLALQPAKTGWQPDPLLATLPERLRTFPGSKTLAELRAPPSDGAYLEETVWLRDISRQLLASQPGGGPALALGRSSDPVVQATELFDWTVRNVQLAPPGIEQPPFDRPQRILLRGSGSAAQRAWIFVLLARQQQLDVAVLGLDDAAHPGQPRPWAVALLSAGEAFLFDAELGLPIPGPGGAGVATLQQVAADDSLLRRLDLDAEHPYPVKAADLARVVALVEAAPPALARRMEVFQAHLAGRDRLVLSVSPTALAGRWRGCAGVSDVRLWTLPFETYREIARRIRSEQPEEPDLVARAFQEVPPLLKGRQQHFKGNYAGDPSGLEGTGASLFYTASRVSDADLAQIRQVFPAPRWQAIQWAKQSASFWLGLVAYERGLYHAAVGHFQTRCLEAYPDGPWTEGARYNLARCHEALGAVDQAVALYRQGESRQRHGDLLRARWLQAERASQPAAADAAGQP